MTDPLLTKDKTDEELVSLALQDQDNFVYLINRYEQKLFSYIMRLTNALQEDAEDILQEVFIKVYENLNDFDPSLKFSSWIYRITHNQVISRHRRLKARAEGYATVIDERLAETLASDLDVATDLDRKLLTESVNKILGKLSAKHREILVLKYIEGKSYQEISDIIMKPMGSVASRMNKAKKEFRKQLDREGGLADSI
jgi:RNA polymerase sigma-70 factor (ECF subfamily)